MGLKDITLVVSTRDFIFLCAYVLRVLKMSEKIEIQYRDC